MVADMEALLQRFNAVLDKLGEGGEECSPKQPQILMQGPRMAGRGCVVRPPALGCARLGHRVFTRACCVALRCAAGKLEAAAGVTPVDALQHRQACILERVARLEQACGVAAAAAPKPAAKQQPAAAPAAAAVMAAQHAAPAATSQLTPVANPEAHPSLTDPQVHRGFCVRFLWRARVPQLNCCRGFDLP